jgi:hypothetical protein
MYQYRVADASPQSSFIHLDSIPLGIRDAPCPACGPTRRSPSNRNRKVLKTWRTEPGFASYNCARCGISGYLLDKTERTTKSAQLTRPKELEPNKSETARRLWAQAEPARGTPAQRYLESRCCWVDAGTIKYLPGRGPYGHAMIGAFGVPNEPEPVGLRSMMPR